jgi:hypothetical protein
LRKLTVRFNPYAERLIVDLAAKDEPPFAPTGRCYRYQQ